MKKSDQNWMQSRLPDNSSESDLPDWRTEFARDRDRIIHSEGFRKLQDKSQIFGTVWMPQLFSRVTHSIQVSQIGRSIAAKLRHERPELKDDLDADLMEAICLAHDIGHPPFGHEGEQALQFLMEKSGGFEGNAQTFRVLTVLEERRRRETGLHLTNATLLGVLKYPWSLQEARQMNSKLSKFCFYEGPDYAKSEVNWKKELFAGITDRDRLNESSPPRTLACDVMDWADTIAYAVHDLEDAFQANFLRADTIQGAEFEWCLLGPQGAVGLEGIDGPFKIRWKKHVEKNTIQPDEANRIEASEQLKWFKDTFKFVHPHPALLTKSQSLREVASKLIHEFVTSLEVESTSHQPPFHLKLTLPSADLHAKLVFMQCVVQEVVVRDVRVRTFALRSRKMLTDAFGSFEKELDDSEQSSHTYEKYQLFRRRHRDKLKSIDKRSGCRDEKLRLIADMLASMSEAQMLDLYDRLFSPRAPNPYSAFV